MDFWTEPDIGINISTEQVFFNFFIQGMLAATAGYHLAKHFLG